MSLSLFHEIVEIKVEEESVVRARAYIRLLLLGVKSPSSVSHMSTSYEKLFSREKKWKKKTYQTNDTKSHFITGAPCACCRKYN